MSAFVPVQLYGGAITVELPSVFGDVRYVACFRYCNKAQADSASYIREVPDTQEVWIDRNGLTSVIFDLTERVDEPEARNDEEALKYHLSDIVEADDTLQTWQFNVASLARMP